MERHRKHYQEDLSDTSMAFPQKLYALMCREDGKTVNWLSHGYAFRISKPEAFVNETVPLYFKHTKLTSFQRQLNLYGFRRLTKGEDQGAYFHPRFQRDRKDLIDEIHRLPAKAAMETLEDVMSVNRMPDGHLTAHKKRALNSSWVTPVRAVDETNHHLPPSSISAMETEQAMGRYRTRHRLAMQEVSTVTPQLSTNSSAPSAAHAASHAGSHAASQNPATNAMGMPLLHIPEDHEPHGGGRTRAAFAQQLQQQQQRYFPPHDSSASTPYYAGGASKSKLATSLGYSEDTIPGRGYLTSPAHRFHTDDLSDLCPDLIGSPFYSGMIDQSLLTAAAEFDGLPSPTGMCILPTTPAHLRAQAALQGQFSASSATVGAAVPLESGFSIALARQAKPAVLPALTASTVGSEESNAAMLVSPQGPHAPVDFALESTSASAPADAPVIPAAEAGAGAFSSSGALSTGEEHDSPWMSGHVSDAFDALLDMFCGPVDTPIATAAPMSLSGPVVPMIPAHAVSGSNSGGDYSSGSSSGGAVGGSGPSMRVPVLPGMAGADNMLWNHDGAHLYVRSGQYA